MLSSKLNYRVFLSREDDQKNYAFFAGNSYSPANYEETTAVEFKSRYPEILTYIGEFLVSGDIDLCSPALQTISVFLE